MLRRKAKRIAGNAQLPAVGLVVLMILSVVCPAVFGQEVQKRQNPPKEEIAQKLETIARQKGIPCVILKTLAFMESSWRQFDESGDCIESSGGARPGLGIMQVYSYDPADAELVEKLKNDMDFNISYGADLLNSKWNMVPQIGDGDRNILENWYFVLWAYSSWTTINNPNNAAALGQVSYQDAFIKKAATEYFPGLVSPVRITPIPSEFFPVDTLPGNDRIWETPEPYTRVDLESESWTMRRIKGNSRIDTVNQIALAGWPEGAQTVVITRDDDFPDALAGVSLAQKNNAPILVTNPKQLDKGVIDVLAALNPQQVIILGGYQAVGKEVEEEIEGVTGGAGGISRIAGADRYETAALIAGQFPAGTSVGLATGMNYPDALTLAAATASMGIPLLLTSPQTLPQVTRDSLRELSPVKIFVAGGKTAVSSQVLQEVSSLTGPGLKDIERFAGDDRYETSAQIASAFFPGIEEIYLATGQDFTDPLAAGALAAKHKSGLLLVSPDGIPGDSLAETFLRQLPGSPNITVIGDETKINKETVERVQDLIRPN